MRKITMAKVRIESMMKEKFDSCILIKEKLNKEPPLVGDYTYEWYKPPGLDNDNYKEDIKNPEYLKEIKSKYPRYDSFELMLDKFTMADIMLEACRNEVQVSIVSEFEISVGNESQDNPTIVNLMEIHTELMHKQMMQLKEMSSQVFNSKVQVPTTDVFLRQINQTMILYDACTDQLQQSLKDGWRILSICPQPDQRRPDYVLGKIVDEPESSATRY